MPRAIFLANRPGDRPLRFLPKGKTALTPPFASLLHETTTAELDPNFLPEPALGSQAVESMPDELIKSADLDGFLRDVKGLDNLAVHSRMAARSTRTKGKALQILLVEDNVGDARLLYEMFSQERPDSFKLTHLMRMSEAEVHLAKGGVDIILLDMGLPDDRTNRPGRRRVGRRSDEGRRAGLFDQRPNRKSRASTGLSPRH